MGSLYNPLPAGEHPHIRLLALRPAQSETDPIRCSIAPFDLTTAPTFEALSYCWGDLAQKKPIECNNRPFQVTNNLYAALPHLRYKDKERILWIDAICINQEDKDERSAQVVFMRDIYRRAERVLVWLGPSADGSDMAYSTLRRLSQYWPEIAERWSKDKMSAVKLGPYRKTLQQLVGSKGIAQSDDIETDERFQLQPREIATLRAVLERPWWTRVWVIQEICVATAVTMVCGHNTMSWNDLSCGYAIALGPGGMLARIGETSWGTCCLNIYQLKLGFDRMRHEMQNLEETSAHPPDLKGFYGTLDMRQMVYITTFFQASDQKDKIYGIVGLVDLHPDEDGLSIVPNYKLSVVECYQNAALTIMLRSGNLRLLQDVGFVSPYLPRMEGLPSWVPDWSYNLHSTWAGASWGPASPFKEHAAIAQISMFALTPETLSFHACGENEKCHPRVVDGSILVLEGHVVDTVAVAGQILHGELEHDNEDRWKLFGEERTDKSLLLQLRLFIDTCLRVSVFVRALLGWEDLAFADHAQRTKIEKETFLDVIQGNDHVLDLDTSIHIYERNWRMLNIWLRRLAFLQIFGRGIGILTVYNFVLGFVCYFVFTRSRSKSHLVTLIESMSGSRLARTTGGRLAQVPQSARIGDSIALLRGGKYPFVVRPKGPRWELVGSAYVAEIMNGEAWQPSAAREMEFI